MDSQQQLQHRRVLFLVSLPETPVFLKYTENVIDCTEKLRAMGVDVSDSISAKTLSAANRYDIVVVVSHLDEDDNCLVLADGKMDIATFVKSLPTSFEGIIDFASCNSAQWIAAIKNRCPNCHVLGSKNQTALPFRLFIYPYVMQLYLSNDTVNYKDAFVTVQEMVKAELSKQDSSDSVEAATKLGKKVSSVYVPSSIVRSEPFMVQLFLYDESTSNEAITLQAQRYDPETQLVETQKLPIKLKKGDHVSVGFSTFSTQPDCFMIESPVVHKVWDGTDMKFQFNVIVSDSFKSNSFTAKLVIEVNHQPVGDCSFKIKVSEKNDDAPAEIVEIA